MDVSSIGVPAAGIIIVTSGVINLYTSNTDIDCKLMVFEFNIQ
jgi:hypothetical protein